jgi:hypothetical protein
MGRILWASCPIPGARVCDPQQWGDDGRVGIHPRRLGFRGVLRVTDPAFRRRSWCYRQEALLSVQINLCSSAYIYA